MSVAAVPATLQYDESRGRLFFGGRMVLLTGVAATGQNLDTAFRTERGSFEYDNRVGFPANLALRQGLINLQAVGPLVDDTAARTSGVISVIRPARATRVNKDGVDVIQVDDLTVLDASGEGIDIANQELTFG